VAAVGAASRLDSAAGSLLAAGMNIDGTLADGGNLSLAATQLLGVNGQAIAAGDATLRGGGIDLAAGQAGARNLSLTATRGDIDLGRATVSAAGTFSARADAGAAQTLITDGGKLSAGQLDLAVANLSNAGGEIVQTGAGDTAIALASGGTAGRLDNTGGRIAANSANLTIKAGTLTNTGGPGGGPPGGIEHAGAGTLAITAATLEGAGGLIQSNGTLDLRAAAATLDGGRTVARQVAIDAATLGNRGGQILQTGDGAAAAVKASILLDNTGGTVASNGGATLAVGDLLNRGGTIQAAGAASLAISATGAVDNGVLRDAGGNPALDADGGLRKGVIQAGGAARLAAASLDNRQGQVTAGGPLTAAVAQALDNRGGTLASGGDLAAAAGSLDNTNGTVASVTGNVTIETIDVTTNTHGRIEAVGNVTLVNRGFINNNLGVITGQNLSIDTRNHALNNDNGTIVAHDVLGIQSGALSNDFGLIQSNGALSINTHSQELTNTNSGTIKGIISQSTAFLSSA